MGVLEQVTQMRSQGRTDAEIISDLKKQKVSPKEINDALNHAQIKDAVSDISGNESVGGMPPAPSGSYPGQNFDQQAPAPAGDYSGNYGTDYNQAPQQAQADYGNAGYPNQDTQYPAEQNYPSSQGQDYYQQGGYDQSYSQPASSTDTIVEVSEQVFEEKSREMAKKLDSFEEFKALTQTKLDHLNEKVKRIEAVMDKLQAAILEKIGSYGSNLSSIKKEMSMMQDTFARTMEPLAEKARKKSSGKEHSKKK